MYSYFTQVGSPTNNIKQKSKKFYWNYVKCLNSESKGLNFHPSNAELLRAW